ncbi:hypothetical protein P154DRAFT_616643 [Amniculicola lignicola CBS 123094]|uniref:Zn(2)-C6 fungal-type domain-containing protein n=1 Tax=Amniculicola lignicola CBS 123094 TaxID=1392246 RepID=A0A6A5WV93_9PLEO|nr:hypothetical protein P154DRAFT_616643 [Amniculicola lignicola CBS 123094]
MSRPSPSTVSTLNASVNLCPLCAKPFTAVTAYKRHLTYCRRTNAQPRKRGKSCFECSRAKTKCSFHTTCNRCQTKGLECGYSQPMLPLVGVPEMVDLGELVNMNLEDFALELDPVVEASFRLDSTLQYTTATSYQRPPVPNSIVPFQLHNNIADQSAMLILQQFRGFPARMLRRDNLPPFIHPRWQRSVLPEPIAVCNRIVGIFSTRTVDITPFVWRTVLAEQKRWLQEDVTGEDLLAAVQAQLIYTVMRIIDPGDGSAEASKVNRELLSIGGCLCESFSRLSGSLLHENETLTVIMGWQQWIFAESRRRTACAWLLLARIVSVKTGLFCHVRENIENVPLPSGKMLWEATSEAAWETEMIQTFDRTHDSYPKTFGSLLDVHANNSDPSSAQQLDNWTANVDSLGTMMSIGIAMF